MNFDFQQMKPIIQREFNDIFEKYPTDMSAQRELIPIGGDAYERKRIIIGNAAEMCPVHVFPHYPFAYEMDMGEARHVCYVGIGNECLRRSGVDMEPLFETNRLLGGHNLCRFGYFTDFLHRTLDHDKLLRVGFRGAWEECAELNKTETDPEKKRYRELVMFCCECVNKIGLRLRARAAEMLNAAADEDARYNLTRIINSANTPWEPPVTMFDALNSILCTTLFISGLDGVEMNAYGQLDRLIAPFYERDLASGAITYDEAYFLIQCFLHKTDMHCLFNDERKTFDNGVSVMIGGCDPEGNTVYNAVTDMVIRAYTENKLINPKLNARASADSPREYIEKLVALAQTGNNNLVIHNDDYVVPMFLRMGLLPEDARTYVGNGCQEVICRNQVHSRAFVYLNMAQVLIDTLKYDETTLPETLRTVYRFGSFDKSDYSAFQASFLKNLRSLIIRITETFHPYERSHLHINPEPMFSCFTADCIARGRDNSDMGARYNHKTLSLVGFGTLCDSLLSLRRAYAEGTQEALFSAVIDNFEHSETLRRELEASPDRFGHSPEADKFAKALAHELAEVSRGIKKGCPYCSGRKVLIGFNDLFTANPFLMKEWDYEKNGDLKPDNITANSTQKVWWKCIEGHIWQATIASRNNGTGCPYCWGRIAIKGKTDLQTVNPSLAKEWNYEKNGALTPDNFKTSSGKKVWWRCNKGHEWQATINHRNNGRKCPLCNSERKTSFPEYALAYYLLRHDFDVRWL